MADAPTPAPPSGPTAGPTAARTGAPTPTAQDTLALLGLVASFELTEVTEAAAVTDPSLGSVHLLASGRRVAAAVARCERVLAEVEARGGSGPVEVARFDGVFDDFDVRTAASTPEEAVLRGFVGRSVAEDLCRLVAPVLDDAARDVVLDVVGAGGVGDDEVDAVARAAAADPVLAARLALWGRRLVGESLRLVQQLLVQHEAFARLAVVARDAARTTDDEAAEDTGETVAVPVEASDATAAWVLRRLTERHALRMKRLGLAA